MGRYGNRMVARGGNTLVEVTIALLVFAITALGAAYYRYLAALDIRRARDLLAGADLAMTFLETWEGAGGSESFDPPSEFPASLDVSSATGVSAPDGYTLLGGYDVELGGRTYQTILYWVDTDYGLRELGTAVSWPTGSGDQKTYRLTAYAEQ